MSSIIFKNVNKIYPNNVQAVFDFNLKVNDKDFIVFVGPSGCGKSTTLRMIAGLEEISSGEIYIDDKCVNKVAPKDRNIAMVFQNYALYPNLSVFDNMAFSLTLRKDLLPVTELDEDNPEYIREVEELEKKYNEEIAKGTSELKAKINKKNKKIIKDKIKELKFQKNNQLNVELKKVRAKYEKQVLSYNRQKVEELEKEIKELSKDKENNISKLESLKNELEQVRAKEDTPLFIERHYNKGEISEKVTEAAESLGLIPYLKRKPAALSGGQRQRVALGRAIVRNPKVFLMDEPLSNLDAKLRVQMRSEIIKIHKTVGATTIYVTHDQTEAMTMATQIVCMKDGYIQQIGTPKELFSNPENMFVAGFIGAPAMNFVYGKFDGEKFTSDNNEITILLNNEIKDRLKDYKDKDIVLGIRPEDVYLTTDNVANPSNKISLKCDISELLGRELIIYNYIGNQKFIIKTMSRDDITSEMNVEYVLDMNRVHFFDKETTKRIK